MSSDTAPASQATTKVGEDGSFSNPLSDRFHPAGYEDQSCGDSAQSSTRSLLSTVVISPQHSQGDLAPSAFKLAIPNHTTPTTARQYVSVTENGTVAIQMPKIITVDNATPTPVSVRELNKILVGALPPAAVAAIQRDSRTSSPLPASSTPELSPTASRAESHHQMLLRILTNASAQGININSLIAEVESRKGGSVPPPPAAAVKPTKLHNGDEDVYSESDDVADLIPPIKVASNHVSNANESSISASYGPDMTLPAVGSTSSASVPTSTSATGQGGMGTAGSPPPYVHSSSALHNDGGSKMGSIIIDGLGSMHNNNDSFSHSSLQTNTFQTRSMYTSNSVNNTTTQMSSTIPGTGSSANTGGGSMNTGGGVTYINGSAIFGSPLGVPGPSGSSMSMLDSMVVQGASMNSFPFPSMSNTNLSTRGNASINHQQSNNSPCPLDQFHPVQFHNAPGGASSGGAGGMLPSVGLEMNSNNNLSTVSVPGISASSRNAEGLLSMQSLLSPFQQQPFSYNPTPASQTMISSMLHQPNDSLNVLSKDRTMLLIIPRQLIDPTEGSAAYDSQVSSHDTHHLAFKFRLCKLYEEGCPQGANCVFIHSCHVLDGVANPDNTLPPSRLQRGLGHLKVVENDVHFNASVTGKVVEHPTLPPGRVFDLKIGRPGPARSGQHQHPKMISVPSEHVLVTKASRAYFYNELNAPKVPQACSHFERACCARGSACGFIHRLVIPSSQSSATNAPTTTTTSTSMPRFEDMSSSSSHNNNSHPQLPPPPPHHQAGRGGYNQRQSHHQQQPMAFNFDPSLAGMFPPANGGGQQQQPQYQQQPQPQYQQQQQPQYQQQPQPQYQQQQHQPQIYNFQPQHHHHHQQHPYNQQNVLYSGARPFAPASQQQFETPPQQHSYQQHQQQMYAAGGQPTLYQQQPTSAPQFSFRGMN